MATFRKIEGGQDTIGIEEQLHYHRRKNFYRFLLVLVIIAVAALIVYNQYKAHVYTGYDVVSSVAREPAAGATDLRLGGNILTYSPDGAHCTDGKGTALWNQTYQIQDIKLTENRNTAAVASYNGQDIFVFNENSLLGSFQTTMPIRNIAVAQSGRVTATVSDGDVTHINTYEADGTQIYTAVTHMSNSGYPAAMALSPSGNLLMVSYIYVDAGTVKTTIAFYNFGQVGDNYKDYLVSGFDYTDEVIPEVGFLSDGAAYAVSDRRIMLFQGLEQPSSSAEFFYSGEVRSVFPGDGYVGIVLPSDKSESKYKLQIYSSAAKLVGNYYLDIEYTDIVFEKEDFIIYNERECEIRTYDDKVKFAGTFQKSVRVLIPTNQAYRYLLVTPDSIDTIQLN